MTGLTPTYRWIPPPRVAVTSELREAAAGRGLSERFVQLLADRGHETAGDLDAFFGAPEAGLHDPSLLPDAAAAVARIRRARDRGERVLVFGDFDADGLTGLTILVTALRRLGIAAEPYVPSRLDEGHGLSLAAVERAVGRGESLIVTVDCGTASVAEVTTARAAGVDVIVTDHHRVGPVLPAAVAVVNPHRADSSYPDPRLAGSGVAFKLAQLLLRDLPDGDAIALELVDLATIGTVADLAPIVGENRCIARLGIARIAAGLRPGLAALVRAAGVGDGAAIDLDTIGFVLAPRLNAAGRVGDATAAARLLLAHDPIEIEALAAELETANLLRREQTQASLEEARLVAAAGDQDAGVIVVAGDWPVGVIGLVAGRLAEERGRPAVVLSRLTEPWRGSARSGAGFDLGAAFERCAELFDRFGGHAGAAGCSLPAMNLQPFHDRMLAIAAEGTPPHPLPALRLDVIVRSEDLGYPLHGELALLAPTGVGNPRPVVGISGLLVTRVRQASGGHTQITLRKGREVLDGIAFGRADLAVLIREGDLLDIAAHLASRSFGGYESLQLELRDVAPAGTLVTLASTVSTILSAGTPAVERATLGGTVPGQDLRAPVLKGAA